MTYKTKRPIKACDTCKSKQGFHVNNHGNSDWKECPDCKCDYNPDCCPECGLEMSQEIKFSKHEKCSNCEFVYTHCGDCE